MKYFPTRTLILIFPTCWLSTSYQVSPRTVKHLFLHSFFLIFLINNISSNIRPTNCCLCYHFSSFLRAVFIVRLLIFLLSSLIEFLLTITYCYFQLSYFSRFFSLIENWNEEKNCQKKQEKVFFSFLRVFLILKCLQLFI